MTDAKLQGFLDRVDQARGDYTLALSQIADDARDAGVSPSLILGELAFRAWCKEKAKDPLGNIYFAQVEGLDVVKIGFSISVPDRMRALRTEHKRDFTVLGTVAGTMSDERWFHSMLWWCRDRSLKGNEFFAYRPISGLIRIFLAIADRFPFPAEDRDQTRAWVERVRAKGWASSGDHATRLENIGVFFERLNASQSPRKAA